MNIPMTPDQIEALKQEIAALRATNTRLVRERDAAERALRPAPPPPPGEQPLEVAATRLLDAARRMDQDGRPDVAAICRAIAHRCARPTKNPARLVEMRAEAYERACKALDALRLEVETISAKFSWGDLESLEYLTRQLEGDV